jgi:Immunoglobulin domain
MKFHIHHLLTGLTAVFLLSGSYLFAATPELATQFDFSSDTTPGARKFSFETIPSHRYKLWRSTDLKNWAPVPGYPQTASGLSIEHTFAQGAKEFFRVEPIDDQAPTVAAQYPAVDGFAVGRFADLNIELADATDIDPASVRLTVGASGLLAPGAPGLIVSGNTITYDSGDSALGTWGATLSATLTASDTLGHTLTHTWSFRLEPEPQIAANIFVFGSPTAQRSGQRVSGPAAALASRFPAPAGPVRASASPPWVIESVLADRIIIAYTAGGAPSFAVGQLICNLAPTKQSEIFYRRVISTSNDASSLKFTVMTEDTGLSDFVSTGAASISQNSVIFDLDGNGTLTRADAPSGTRYFDEVGMDLSGSQIKLLEHGYETTVAGITHTSGYGATLMDIIADKLFWKITPQLEAGVEFRAGPIFPITDHIESFKGIVTGRASYSTVIRATGRLAGTFSEKPVFNFPVGKLVFVGSIGVVPIYTSLNFDFTVTTKAAAQALIQSRMTYQQGAQAAFGVRYQRFTGFSLVNSFQADVPVMSGDAALIGEFSLKVTIQPKVSVIVYGTAGFQASLEPSAKITTRVSATIGPSPALSGELEASLDFVIKPAGPLFDFIYPNGKPELSLNVWNSEWPLVAHPLLFKTQPLSRTVALGENACFTCSVDSPSTPTFQWYQNGKILPRQADRSLFLDRVTSGFAGNYFVRVKAGNQSIDSDIASLTVQSVTPETLDSDRDGVPDI